jgi:hypothetical protein
MTIWKVLEHWLGFINNVSWHPTWCTCSEFHSSLVNDTEVSLQIYIHTHRCTYVYVHSFWYTVSICHLHALCWLRWILCLFLGRQSLFRTFRRISFVTQHFALYRTVPSSWQTFALPHEHVRHLFLRDVCSFLWINIRVWVLMIHWGPPSAHVALPRSVNLGAFSK